MTSLAVLRHVMRSLVAVALGATLLAQSGAGRRQGDSAAPRDGRSVTTLSDGRILLLGGMGPNGQVEAAVVVDPASGSRLTLQTPLITARAWHTATVLPDGTVLVLGGQDSRGRVVARAEIVDPISGTFTPIELELSPRTGHSATVLTDGRVLVAGGRTASGEISSTVEVWDPLAGSVVRTQTGAPRAGHTARLLADGAVLLEGGVDAGGSAAPPEMLFPEQPVAVSAEGFAEPEDEPFFAGSNPLDGAIDVSLTPVLAVRFSGPLSLANGATRAFGLSDGAGSIPVHVTAVEGGRLFFIRAARELEPGTEHLLTAASLTSPSGRSIPPVGIRFTTTDPAERGERPAADDDEVWMPGTGKGNPWESGRSPSPWQQLAPLQGPPGVTALAGQILRLNGKPLADVSLRLGSATAVTDRTGRFLLANVPSGRQELVVDARTASRPGKTYGFFMIAVDVGETGTTALPYTIWMPVLDTAHATAVPGGGTGFVARTPRIPGLEVHVPAGATLRDADGNVASSMTITPIPIDRPPFPLPAGVRFPVYFTLQPGGARLEGTPSAWASGIRLVFPNAPRHRPGTRIDFWSYDSKEVGWFRYGQGTVGADGRTIVPDAGVVIRHFTCASVGNPSGFPGTGPAPGGGPADGDPVDLGTGLFVYDKTDLAMADVLPVALVRTYRQGDSVSRPFGIGTTHNYELHLVGDRLTYTYAELILPDGGRLRYDRTSAGTNYWTAVLEHTATPTRFQHSVLSWNTGHNGWDLRFKDGTVYEFHVDFTPEIVMLKAIEDRYGNRLVLTRDTNNRLTQLLSPSGRTLAFTYDGSDRITVIADSIGRTVTYTYDGSGRLSTVTDARGGVTTYTYDASHRMETIEDARGIVYLTNTYDTNGRVSVQELADGGQYTFVYTLDVNGRVVQTDVTNPRSVARRTTFNGYGYALSDTLAYGAPEAQTTTYVRASPSNRVTSQTDALGRETAFTYDSLGNTTAVTRLAGTGGAVTTTLTYEPVFQQVKTVTDPLNHTTTFSHDSRGSVTGVTDPLNHQTTLAYNAAGQVTTVTNALNHTTALGYWVGDLTSTTTPLGHSATQFVDAAGRVKRATDALGGISVFEYNAHDQVTKIVDPLGGETTFTYDGNGNLLTLTDARGKTTTWTYDTMDRVATRTDPLARQESFTYDLHGNLTSWTDRKTQVTTYAYDALDRQTFVGFGTTGAPPTYESTVTTTYDAGDRAVEIVDSGAGTIERTYDLLDRLTEEVTPEGTITYAYDAADRRTTMQVAGQTAVAYTYDDADRLTAVTQGTAAVGIAYDAADRRTSLTLPNGIVVEYGYDADSRLTGLTYKLGGSPLGDLTYTYDANGQRTAVAGSYARSNLPPALASATYDDANQIASFGGTNFTYDDNGNLTSDGSKSYTWNARNELTALGGGVSASFAYDGVGRRRARTVGGTTTQFLYDGLNPVQELTSGTPTANLLTGLGIDEHFSRIDAAGVRHFLTDALGSTIGLADGSGTVQTEYTYEAFGIVTTSGASSANTFGFTGRENDGTGLNYYRARYYDPRLQRFGAEDPIGFEEGPNLYAYVGNDPISRIDPLGLEIIIVGRVPFIPRSLPPSRVFNPARPIPRASPPQIPRQIPVDPRIPPIRPVTDPFIEFLADILGHFGSWFPPVPSPPSPTAGRKPDCRLYQGVPVCKA